MSFQAWALFAVLALTVIVMPGPAAVLCLSPGVAHGALRTVATIFGLLLSSLVLIALSMSLTWSVLALVVMVGYAALGSRVATAVTSERARTIFNRVTAGVFIAAGGALALAKRADA